MTAGQSGLYSVVVTNAAGSATSAGASLVVIIQVPGIKYVSQNNPTPKPPYTSWSSAATNIQDAINASLGGDVILVTNGVYASGLGIYKPLTLLSVNGPQFTVIDGSGQQFACVSFSAVGSLTGFTLTNGFSPFGEGGGGVDGGGGQSGVRTNAFPTNCVIVDCVAPFGGGAAYCTLVNCTLSGNRFGFGAGEAALSCTMYNCTLSGNGAGGTPVFDCLLYNCILYYNAASFGGTNFDDSCTLNYCCTFPMPGSGSGNFTNSPLFVDQANRDFHLQSNSPCINAGNNTYAGSATDLDGNPRIVAGTVDIGAYEYQGKGSSISYAWLQQYGLPIDGSADTADSDHDGMSNWQEWVCGTNPTNALSALRLVSAIPTGTNAIAVTWQSVAGINYFVERSSGLASPFSLVATNIAGLAGITSCTDTNATGAGPFFYRIGVTGR